MMARYILLVSLLFLCAQGSVSADYIAYDRAILQALDKVTARISLIPIARDEIKNFGSLDITMKSCFSKPPEEPPESVAFLKIDEQYNNQEREEIFKGWMFASSPAINPLQHSVYDIWLKECVKTNN